MIKGQRNSRKKIISINKTWQEYFKDMLIERRKNFNTINIQICET